MSDLTDNYTFFLKIYFKNKKEPSVFKTHKSGAERFKRNIDSYNESKLIQFFVCDTIDGKCIGINLSQIQAVNILWEPSPYPEEQKYYNGSIKILLKNRSEFIETDTEDYDDLFCFYGNLQEGSSIAGEFISFDDEDGEELLINMNELLYIESPKSMTDEGFKIVKEMDGIEE